jgi:four helix bundle protein
VRSNKCSAMPVQTYKDIIAWQKSHQLTLLVYELSEKYPKTETFGLTSQTRRCAVSVPSNIAEGFKRRHKNDSIHFYNISQSSLEELRYQLLLAKDLKYISDKQHHQAENLSDEVAKLIYSWIKSQK